jgi:hypothetical protein
MKEVSLLQQIEKLGIPIADLAVLTEQDIIRIEKKLKADVRLDDSVNLNDVIKIVDSLRRDKTNIATLYHNDFKALRDILKSESEFIFYDKLRIKPLEFRADFIPFLNTDFEDELKTYINRCLKEDHYYALHSFLFYSTVFSAELLQMISLKFEQKLDYLIETMRLGSEYMEEKIEPAMNPFFYRCLNRLDRIQFEDDISTLLNSTIAHVQYQNSYVRILFALGAFKAIGDDLKDALVGNRKIAYEAGIREKTYAPKKPKGKGGTIIRMSNSVHLVKRPGEKNSYGISYHIAWPIIVIIIFLFRWFGPDNNDKKFHIPTSYSETVLMQDFVQIGVEKVDFIAQMNYLHSDTVNIIRQKEIPFNLKSTRLAVGQTQVMGNNRLNIKNETERSFVVVAEKYGSVNPLFYCLKPKELIPVQSQIASVRIYAGYEPQMIDFVNKEGDMLSHFRFNDFTESDQSCFKREHIVNTVFNSNEKQIISISLLDGLFNVDVKQDN